MKIKAYIILLVFLLPISLAITGTRSLTSEYMCEDGNYQITMNPVVGYTMEEILQNWHFSSLAGDAANDCTIQTDDTRVRCAYIGSQTRTLIFNVLNAPGIYNNIFSNDPAGDTASGLASVEVKEKICSPDNDNDKYPSSITNVCGCISSEIDCNDNNPNINPGATEIPGNGIDDDCDGTDDTLPSSISRILPDTIQKGVEFEVILNIRYTGEEPGFVVNENFNENDFNCGKIPTYGECSNGKARWVITNPSFTTKLRYYLIPKSTESCFSGTYQFEARNEQIILGDYAIGTSCLICSPEGEEICDNNIDEDCDGSINMCCECEGNMCEPGNTGKICDGCNYIPAPIEICNGVDDDCDGNIDENVKLTFYKDLDGDGYGSISEIQACANPGGYVDNNYDCDDNNKNINPDAEELCNNIDDNCNNFMEYDESIDYLCLPEICDDGIDNNADGECDYEGCDGIMHGDKQCPITTLEMRVSETGTFRYNDASSTPVNMHIGQNINIFCPFNPIHPASKKAYFNNQECNYMGAVYDYDAADFFSCPTTLNPTSSGTYLAKCTVDSDKAYSIDKTISINYGHYYYDDRPRMNGLPISYDSLSPHEYCIWKFGLTYRASAKDDTITEGPYMEFTQYPSDMWVERFDPNYPRQRVLLYVKCASQ